MRTLNLFLLFFFLFALNSYSLPECKGGDPNKWNNCEGTVNLQGGDKYEGELRGGITFHGQGTYTWADGPNKGDKYVGEWKDGKRNGEGTYTFADGDKYVGEWKDGKRNGEGTYTFADGKKYAGEFKDGKYHGKGTYTFASGTKWEGLWVEGEFKEFKGEKVEEIKTNVTLKKYYNTNVTPRGFFRGIYYYVGDRVCSLTYNLGITGYCVNKTRIQTGMIIFWLLLITIVGGLFGNRKKF